MLELLKLGFSWYFHDTRVYLSLGTIYFGSGYVLDCFFVMDLDYNLSSCNVSFSMFSTSRDSENDVNVWQARLGHIGQQRMNRLAK